MYKTQYIAPLRVKLDPARYNQSTINYVLTETALTIQWTNVTVAEPYEHPNGGRFTFQVKLLQPSTTNFAVIEVPVWKVVASAYWLDSAVTRRVDESAYTVSLHKKRFL